MPRKFSAGTNVGTSKESNPRKAQIMSVDENVLHEKVRLARMLNTERKLLKLKCSRNFYRLLKMSAILTLKYLPMLPTIFVSIV